MPVPLPPALVGSVFLSRQSIQPQRSLTQLAGMGLVQTLGSPLSPDPCLLEAACKGGESVWVLLPLPPENHLIRIPLRWKAMGHQTMARGRGPGSMA